MGKTTGWESYCTTRKSEEVAGRGGEGELMRNKVTLHGGASATAQPDPRQTGICE